MTDINFSDLRIGEPIQTYIYINNVFEPAQEMYPILDGDDLILWAIENGERYQITDALVEEINDIVEKADSFSIIYDRNSSYLYSDNEFTLLGHFATEDSSRSVLVPTTLVASGELETTSLLETEILEYSTTKSRTSIYYECDVDFVTQNPTSNICWAATIACIANYLNGTNLTAIQVAKNYYGSDYDHGIMYYDAPGILNDYDLSYTYQESVPSDSLLLEQIMDGYPVYTSWVSTSNNSGHAVCVYGVAPVSGYIYMMDPEYGFTSASCGSGQYSYVSGYSGYTYTLHRGIYHVSW